jgi:hypothetical protein
MAITTLRRRGAHQRAAADTVPPTEYDRPAGYERPVRFHRPVGVAFTGLLAVLVGAWGAVAGYIGPYFGWHPVAQNAWTASWQNGLLHLIPGAAAVAAGLMLMFMGPARRSVRGKSFVVPAVMLLASGAWFVIGPVAWPTFETGPAFLAAGPMRHLLDVAASSFAVGLVLVMLGGMALKAAAVPPVMIAEDPYTPAEAGTGRTVAAERDVADRNLADRNVADRNAVADRPVASAQSTAPGVPMAATHEGVHPVEGRATEGAPVTERPEV